MVCFSVSLDPHIYISMSKGNREIYVYEIVRMLYVTVGLTFIRVFVIFLEIVQMEMFRCEPSTR